MMFMKRIVSIFTIVLMFLSVNVYAQIDFGTEVNHNGITNYVTSDGLYSALIDNENIIWIKVNSNGDSIWFGLDNSKDIFKEGSRFWVKYLSNENNGYNDYEENLDSSQTNIEDNKNFSIKIGVLDANGNNIVGQDVKVYIQVFDDMELNDIYAIFEDSNFDENSVDMELLDCPDGKYNFAKIGLFSLNEIPLINDNQEKIYKLILDANGGKFGDKDTYVVEDITKFDYTKFNKPTRDGYKFIGFFTEKVNGKSFEEVMSSEVGIEEDMTFYARWEKEENNPETFDGIAKNIFIIFVSLVGLIGTVIYFNKENKVRA